LREGTSGGKRRRLSLKLVLSSMAVDAEGDKVFSRVVPQPAAKCSVVNLEVFEGPADLASPAIPLQDLFVKTLIVSRIEFESG